VLVVNFVVLLLREISYGGTLDLPFSLITVLFLILLRHQLRILSIDKELEIQQSDIIAKFKQLDKKTNNSISEDLSLTEEQDELEKKQIALDMTKLILTKDPFPVIILAILTFISGVSIAMTIYNVFIGGLCFIFYVIVLAISWVYFLSIMKIESGKRQIFEKPRGLVRENVLFSIIADVMIILLLSVVLFTLSKRHESMAATGYVLAYVLIGAVLLFEANVIYSKYFLSECRSFFSSINIISNK
jgi:hypothetical protein